MRAGGEREEGRGGEREVKDVCVSVGVGGRSQALDFTRVSSTLAEAFTIAFTDTMTGSVSESSSLLGISSNCWSECKCKSVCVRVCVCVCLCKCVCICECEERISVQPQYTQTHEISDTFDTHLYHFKAVAEGKDILHDKLSPRLQQHLIFHRDRRDVLMLSRGDLDTRWNYALQTHPHTHTPTIT